MELLIFQRENRISHVQFAGDAMLLQGFSFCEIHNIRRTDGYTEIMWCKEIEMHWNAREL